MIDPKDGSVLCDNDILISRLHTPAQLMKLAAKGELLLSANPHVGSIRYVTGLASKIGGSRFEVSVEFHDEEIEQIFFKMCDGPASRASWDDVSEKKLKAEIELIEAAATDEFSKPPTRKRHLFRSWTFSWGDIQAIAEIKSFQCGLFLKYRRGI